MEDKRPFSGIKVLDLSRVLASPFAAYQLALLGADVVKIEDPRSGGDQVRHHYGHNPEYGKHGMAIAFLTQNSNKKSLTLDLRTQEGQEIFRKLAKDADVVVQNFRTGTMEKYGLGYEDLRKFNPRLVYCSLTGYGGTGPWKRYPAFDPVVQAASGMMTITGSPATAPLKTGGSVVDYATGMSAALGIVTALYQRQQTGKGQHVDVAMLDINLALMSASLTDTLTNKVTPKASGNVERGRDSYTNGCFQCKDQLLCISASRDHQRQHLWAAIGRSDIPQDPRFSSDEACYKNIDALHAELEKTLKTKTAQEWEDILNAAGVPAQHIRSIPEILDHPQIKSRNMFHTFDKLPGVGLPATVPVTTFQLSEAKARIDSPPPLLGQHSREILKGLGMADVEIDKLKQTGII